MIAFIVILIILLLVWLNFIWNQRKYYALASKLQGPPAFPLIGSTLSFIGSGQDTFTKFINIVTRYASPVRIWVGPKLYLYIDRPEQIQVILNSPQCLDKENVYKFLSILTEEGLLTLEPVKWKYHRKLLNPSFGTKLLIGFMDIFNDASKILSDRLETIANRHESVDIFDYLSDCTLDAVCKTAMGLDLKLQENGNSDYFNALVNGLELVCHRIFNFWLHPEWIYKWTNDFRQQHHHWNVLNSLPRSILEKRKYDISKDEKLRAAFLDEDENSKKPQIFLNQLLKLSMQGHDLPDKDILGELTTIILAGNETSAAALASTILALSFYPEIQERVFNEIKGIFPKSDCKVEYEDLPKLQYLEMVLKETMRFYTITPLIGRRTSGECKLGDLTIPADVGIAIGFSTLHRHKDIWGADADEFNPDHFLPEVAEKRHPYSFIPFSAGSRNCIGQKYAMMSMKTLMVHLCRKYRFTTKLKPDELKYEIKITLKLMNKHMVEIHRRD